MVVQQAVSFRNQTDFNAHRLLRAIDLNIVLSKLPQQEQGSKSERMVPIFELLDAFRDFPQIIENTNDLVSKCSVKFTFDEKSKNQNQKFFLVPWMKITNF